MTQNGAASRGSTKRTTQFYGTMQKRRAKLVVIRGSTAEGESFSLEGDNHLVGRTGSALSFANDPFLSPVHADFFYRDNALWIADHSSVNGIYMRINEPAQLQFGEPFIIGEQFLQLMEAVPTAFVDSEDTTLLVSLKRQPSFFVVQILRGGDIGMVVPAESKNISIGRSECTINFPNDTFMSGTHADIQFANDVFTLRDLNSKNGTFVKIKNEAVLQHGDYVFLGQQLLRVEII